MKVPTKDQKTFEWCKKRVEELKAERDSFNKEGPHNWSDFYPFLYAELITYEEYLSSFSGEK